MIFDDESDDPPVFLFFISDSASLGRGRFPTVSQFHSLEVWMGR